LVVLAVSVFFLSGCGRKSSQDDKVQGPPVVEVAVPLEKEIEVWDSHATRIEGQKAVNIRARVSGYLEKVCFKDGDFVKEGDVLFEIDARPFAAVVEACKAAVIEVEAKIALAQSNFDRAKELFAANAISKEILETRRSELLASQAMLLSAQATLKQAQLDLEFTKIITPISGYVARRLIDEGNLVNASETLLTRVVSREVVYAYFEVSERDILRYAAAGLMDRIDVSAGKGPPVRFQLMDEPQATHFGELTYADNALEASSLQLRADINNPQGRLYPGMFGTVFLRVGAPVKRLLVPELAVGTDLVKRYVYVVDKDDVVHYRPVILGEVVGTLQVILEGIQPGERVIVNGIQRAMQGKKVQAIEVELKDE